MADVTFDDLIPKSGAAPGGGGVSFDDLIPKVSRGDALRAGIAQGASFNMGDEISAAAMAAPGALGKSEDTKRLLDQKMKEQYGVNLPSIPSPLAAIAGGARMLAERVAPSYFGNEGTKAYEKDVAASRQEIKAAEDQYPGTSFVGNLVGGAAVPLGAATGVKQGMKVGAAAGGAYGFGSGEGLGGSVEKAAYGAGLGAAFGGALGKVLPAQSSAQAPIAAPDVVAAAERVGVTIPTAVASNSQAVQRAGQAVRVVPGAGERMTKAIGRTQQEATQALDNMASSLGSGDVVSAGNAVAGGIRNWVTGESKAALQKAYDAVDQHINPAVTTPLSSTQGVVADILASRQASRISDPGKAVNFVSEAIQDAQGLTYEGIKGLRTRVGEMLDNPSMLPAETSKSELKKIYGALTDDLSKAVENSGGVNARLAWERANSLNKAVAQRREDLAKIVGENADVPAEKVFARIQAMASGSSSANAALLAKARNAVGSDWPEVSSAVVAIMGRDANGAFTPDRFVTAYGKLSETGKNLLFDKTTRAALDDINTVAARMQDAFKKYGNPSGTAQNMGWGGAGAALATNPIAAIGGIIGGNALSVVLAKPATASSMAKWAKAYEAFVTRPTAGTVAALNIASRNFASNVAEKTGATVTGEQIIKALTSGMNPSRADSGQPE